MQFARLTTVDHAGKRETLTVEILGEGPAWLVAKKVNHEGEDCESRYDGDTLVSVTRLIDVGTIVKRVPLVMNNHYGELEEPPMQNAVESEDED